MGSEGFEIDQSHPVLTGVAQEVQLSLSMELVNPERRQIALLLLTARGILGDNGDRGIDISGLAIVQLLIDSGKAAGLADLPAHV